jgi:hypothetical protein
MIIFRATTIGDRVRLTIENTANRRGKFPTFTTVKFSDGSERLMADNGLWDFIPHNWEVAAHAAVAMARNETVRFPWCIPADHKIEA